MSEDKVFDEDDRQRLIENIFSDEPLDFDLLKRQIDFDIKSQDAGADEPLALDAPSIEKTVELRKHEH